LPHQMHPAILCALCAPLSILGTHVAPYFFDITDQLLIRFSAFVRYWRKNGSTMRQYISYS
jgi:hypothetical protein